MNAPLLLSKTSLLSLLLCFVLSTSSTATEYIFDGVGDYTDASLWSPSYPTGQIPAGDVVTISDESVCTIPSNTFIFIRGTFINHGDLNTHTTMGAFNDGSIINHGYWHAIANIDNLGNIINHGTIEAEGTFSSQGEGVLENRDDAVIINNAIFIASSSSNGSHVFEGLFQGGGTIHVQDYTNLGVISPGFSPGILTFKQHLFLANSGTIEIEIAGNNGAGQANGHDQIIVQNSNEIGNLDIDGTLKVVLLDNFVPQIGDEWIIATGATAGNFSNLDLPNGYSWEVDIQANAVVLKVVETSLPIDLVHFEARQMDNLIQLQWQASSDDQHHKWVLDFLNENEHWETLEIIINTDYSSSIYWFNHLSPHSGLNYYRLSQVNKHEQTSYSHIIDIDFQPSFKEVRVYPNPTKGLLHFSHEVSSVSVYTVQGQLIFSTGTIGNGLDLSEFACGLYLLVYIIDEQEFREMVILETNLKR